MSTVSIKNVTKVYDDETVIDTFNAEIKDGEFITLLGPSGCGKTTLLRMIAGFRKPSTGSIAIDGKIVSDDTTFVPPERRGIGMVFQTYAVWPHMNVFDNVAYPLKIQKLKKDEIKKRVGAILEIVHLSQYEKRMPSQLSGGQQQRVALGRALVAEPKLLLLDEPLSNLDAKLRSEMRTELKRLHSDTNSTFVYVTHDQLEAMTLATRICLIEKGDLQQYDPPLVVYNRPANLFVADFIGNPTMNFVPAKAKQTAKNELAVQFFGIDAVFACEKDVQLEREDVIIGIRPEFLPIRDSGAIEGLAYSTLPSGMETIVKINLKGDILSSVVFGSIDYAVDKPIRFDIVGDDIIVFDTETKKNICLGSVKVK